MAGKLIKLLVLFLCLTLFPIPVTYAAQASTYEDYAESLSELGVFVGTGSGFELERTPTRIEGIVMLIRLLGAEEEANNMKNTTLPFTDVPKWAAGYVAYAYENGLTNGVGSTKFGSTNKMEAKAYLTFLLRSLGYNDQAGDFSYGNALVFSRSIDLIDENMFDLLNGQTFLRAYVAKTSYDALRFPYKGSNVILIDKLTAENKIDQAVSEAFKKLELTEPTAFAVTEAGTISIEDNLKSVVMLECYGNYSEEYGPDIGSGVIISSDGRIVTNYHVIEGEYDIDVTFNDETVYNGPVYVEDYDEELDLAVIKIDKTGLTPAKLGASGEAKAGDPVITIGSPLGYINTVTEGIISGIRKDSIQISAAINPGNSGGGLFDKNGKLIGITNSGYYMADNMGFAVPVDYLTEVSSNQNISLESFFAKTTEPLPPAPTGLSVLYETKTTALLKWNPVEDADCYDIYCKESGDEGYYYYDSVYEMNDSYSYLAVDLIPGEQYSFKVSAERGDQESNMSTEVSFRKSYSDFKHGSFNLFYAEHPQIPDYGKLADLTAFEKDTNEYRYKIMIDEMVYGLGSDYGCLLEDCGFEYFSSFSSADGSATVVYANAGTKQTITMSVKYISEDELEVDIKIN